ncbi:hypothetical protein SA2016_2275 [Sinomonas atrocyanea]|uniref:Uncharacterized protein n=1 Tax=Sinomonas atrocyanea TaxID=37927 RepID=A0A127A2C6_9MICC|nr:hypothetical protein [Sinomonas atrocyanea]AMM32944.1 hypothetical protein SA2016_2275 [Sinomonas atrocyanea]GEB65654.1 hypothetical protein SAT01_31020 [Sinomonas atrocyanea]GGG75462.1 hypothetical protein GCM10007172_30370 [Sinomonas atrocyanea]
MRTADEHGPQAPRYNAEQRMKTLAEQKGLRLERSGTADGQPTYWLIDPRTDAVIAGEPTTRFGLTLDEVAQVLRDR